MSLSREGPPSLPFHGAQPTSAAEVWVPSEHPQLVPSARRLVSLVRRTGQGPPRGQQAWARGPRAKWKLKGPGGPGAAYQIMGQCGEPVWGL